MGCEIIRLEGVVGRSMRIIGSHSGDGERLQ